MLRTVGSLAVLLAAVAAQTMASADTDKQPSLRISIGRESHSRIQFGAERLKQSLVECGLDVRLEKEKTPSFGPDTISVGCKADGGAFTDSATNLAETPEAFSLVRLPDGGIVITGADPAGALYGCLELAERVRMLHGKLPAELNFTDAPKMSLRGPCVFMIRPSVQYDNSLYDCRYLPETFPWFYDKEQWTKFLDLMVAYRFNTLYLWNGHPFTSILRLEKYPEARELEPEQLEANIQLFGWLCAEANRRNIWVVQNHYNIHVSHEFSRHHNLGAFTFEKPTPLLADYMRYCYSEFVKNYPNVGLMLCLGEALEEQEGPAYMRDVVIPGVEAGLAPGQVKPPIIVRSHDTPIFDVLKTAKPTYSNIYVESKYNNEVLASDVIGGGTDPSVTRWNSWETDGQANVRLAKETQLITNVHCVANLEPFRWASPQFVQRSMQSSVDIGAKGLHLYPLRWADWPVTADKAAPQLLQQDRDWMWFATWARYSWNPTREKATENAFWTQELARRYGNEEAAKHILAAYQLSGEVMPYIARTLAVDSSNYLATSMGQTLMQMFDSLRWYNPLPGETVLEFAERETDGVEHVGESPLEAARSFTDYAEQAVKEAEQAAPLVAAQKADFEGFLNDVRAIRLVARFYAEKADAAIAALQFRDTGDFAHADRCIARLGDSIGAYRDLAALTDQTYLDAASRHDPGRQFPYPAPEDLVWSDMLPHFEEELALVKDNVELLRKNPGLLSEMAKTATYNWAPVWLRGDWTEAYMIGPNVNPFSDDAATFGPELPVELTGIVSVRVPKAAMEKPGAAISFFAPLPYRTFAAFAAEGGPGWASAPKDWREYKRDVTLAGKKWNIYVKDSRLGATTLSLDGNYLLLGFAKRIDRVSAEPPRLPLTTLYGKRIEPPKSGAEGVK